MGQSAVGSALYPHSRVDSWNILVQYPMTVDTVSVFLEPTTRSKRYHTISHLYQSINRASPVSPKSGLPVASLMPLRTVPPQLVKSKGCKNPETAATLRISPNNVDTRLSEELPSGGILYFQTPEVWTTELPLLGRPLYSKWNVNTYVCIYIHIYCSKSSDFCSSWNEVLSQQHQHHSK